MKFVLRIAPLFVLLGSWPAWAVEVTPGVDVTAYAGVRITLYEQMEEVSGLVQQPQGDKSEGSATGFAIDQARIRLAGSFLKDKLGLVLELRLEKGPALLDAYGEWRFGKWLAVRLGQFRIPSGWENLVGDRDLDFSSRPQIQQALADYALSRTTYASSLFYGNRSWRRDVGLGLCGDIDIKIGTLRYLAMVSNGLGANLFIGGATEREYLVSNKAQFFYGLRVDLLDLFGVARVGAHVSYNRHDNVVFNSGRTVLDLNRLTWSVDAGFEIPKTGLRAHGMVGQGFINDDYDANSKRDYKFFGGEVRLIWRLDPLIRLLAGTWDDSQHLELGVRYDRYDTVADESAFTIRSHVVTTGIQWIYDRYLRVHLDYVVRRTQDPTQKDLDDDAVLLSTIIGW
jgi:hypothetical protein